MKSFTKRCGSLACLASAFAIAAGVTGLAPAAQLTYTSLPLPVPDTRAGDITASAAAEASFLSTLTSHVTETFDELAGSPVLGQGNPTITFGASGITAATTFSGLFQVPVLPVSTPIALVEQPAAAGQPAWGNGLTFSAAITAFGSYFIQAGDMAADTLTLRLENTLLGTSKDVVIGTVGPGASFSNVFYFGVTDTQPFNRVTLLPSNSGDGIVLDNVTVGNIAVPEPGTFLLLATAALPLLGRFVRRTKLS